MGFKIDQKLGDLVDDIKSRDRPSNSRQEMKTAYEDASVAEIF